jgi:glutamate synthase (NADPH/NADH) large chain
MTRPPARRKQNPALGEKQGLYDPVHEHDACGVGFVAHIKGQASHQVLRKAVQVLLNLEHRGACGCDPESGDGAGVLMQLPDRLFRQELAKQGLELPASGAYAVGMIFLDPDSDTALHQATVLQE